MKKFLKYIVPLIIIISIIFIFVYHTSNLDSYNGLYNKSKLYQLNNSTNGDIITHINKLKNQANKLLTVKTYPSVTMKTTLISKGETSHDFASMTPYLWNDSTSKSGYIVKDGIDNPKRLDGSIFDSIRLKEMEKSVDTLSLAYAITHNENYAAKAVDFLNAWFINSNTKMNPNMKYAEIFVNSKGHTYFSNSSMISAIPFINIVNDIYLLKGSTALTKGDLSILKAWFKNFNTWLLNENKGGLDRLRIDNHGTWLQAELATFNIFSGNTKNAIKALNAVGPYSISPQIKGSGKIPSALIRTKSVSYTEYNLEAFITLASMGNKLKVPIWEYVSLNGGSIFKAINYLNNYLLGKEPWPYENIKGKNVNENETISFIPYLGMAYNYKKDPLYLKTINKFKNKLSNYNYLILQSEINL